MGIVQNRLAAAGITLPKPSVPSANYVPYRAIGNMLYVAGQVPALDGVDQFTGRLGEAISIEAGQAAARLCAVNLLAQAAAALGGDLERVVSVVRLGGFVNATPDFRDHPKVINGASDLMVEIFGDAGRHMRFAVGAASLPRNVPVEIEGLFEVR